LWLEAADDGGGGSEEAVVGGHPKRMMALGLSGVLLGTAPA
jgi:hypothetical protein